MHTRTLNARQPYGCPRPYTQFCIPNQNPDTDSALTLILHLQADETGVDNDDDDDDGGEDDVVWMTDTSQAAVAARAAAQLTGATAEMVTQARLSGH